MKQLFVTILFFGIMISVSGAAELGHLKDPVAKESYSLGYQFGANIKMQEIAVEKEILLSAVRDALEGKQPLLSPEDIREIMFNLRRKTMVMQDKRVRELAVKNHEEGRTFLESNMTKEGVITLPSGLEYKIEKQGDGPRPSARDIVKVNYRGTLINGTEFDSTFNSRGPAIIKVDDVIKGWTEALQLMKAGSKWQIFVPSDLAYGGRQFGRIPAGSTLIFDIELLSIEDPATLIQHGQSTVPAEDGPGINN